MTIIKSSEGADIFSAQINSISTAPIITKIDVTSTAVELRGTMENREQLCIINDSRCG